MVNRDAAHVVLLEPNQESLDAAQVLARKLGQLLKERGFNVFRLGILLISLGSPRVLRARMGHTCGEPDEIDSPAIHGFVSAPFPGLANITFRKETLDE